MPGYRYLAHPVSNRPLHYEAYTTVGSVCHITIRAYEHFSPFQQPELNNAIVDLLKEERVQYSCSVHVFCLMPDHIHLMLSPSEHGCSVLTFVDRFKGKTTNLSWTLGWQGKLWQPRYYDRVLRLEDSLTTVGQYILDNPVRSGLVERFEDYQWSGMLDPLPI